VIYVATGANLPTDRPKTRGDADVAGDGF